MYSVNIDAGGTMTDGLIVGEHGIHVVKVDSTPHDLTVAMMALIDQAASELGFPDRRRFLKEVTVIRWSSTVTTNVLAERRGPRVGVLVDAGQEQALYGDGTSPAIDDLVSSENVIGIESSDGEDPAQVIAGVRELLKAGVRRICVSFSGAFADPAHEQRAKAAITAQYPDHYLGSVPVLLGSDMARTPDDTTRTHYSIINAYVHPALAASLFKAEDDLLVRDGWRGSFLVGHTNGGVARIAKTKASDTIESGPVFGTHAGAYFARRYGLDALVCIDVGGTTAKASMVRDGAPVEQHGGDVFGIPLGTPMQMLRSLALGGGSIVSVEEGRLVLGPESMGASPGPACYGLGGTRATLTDCLAVLGYVDPGAFLGGRRHLELDRARAAIGEHVAGPLETTVEAAAVRVRDRASGMLGDLIERIAREAGVEPAQVPVFAYGGNGPLLAVFAAERLGLDRIYVSLGLGPVFSAFGTSISNVKHVYETSLVAANGAGDVPAQLRALLAAARERAGRDLESEGFDPGRARFSATLHTGAAFEAALELPANGEDLPALPPFREAVLRTRIEHPMATYDPEWTQGEGGARASAPGEREIWTSDAFEAVPAYRGTELASGSVIGGPAAIGGGSVSCLVPAGWRLEVDQFGNGRMTREG